MGGHNHSNESKGVSSPMEMILSKSPLAAHWTCVIIGVLIFVAYPILATIGAESDIASVSIYGSVYAFSIPLLMYGEYWMGLNIARSLRKLCNAFDMDRNLEGEVYQEIRNIPKRLGYGIILSAVLMLPPLFPYPAYSYLPLLVYSFAIAAIARFIIGEMIPGVYSLNKCAKKIGYELRDQIDVIDDRKLDALKDLAGWGLQMSTFGGFVAIAALVGVIYDPSRSAILPQSVAAGSVIVIASFFIVWAFISPTIEIHMMMRQAKQELRQEISERYNHLFQELRNLPRNKSLFKDQVRIRTISDLMDAIDKMEIKAKEAPEWPFDVRQVQKAMGTFIAPIIIFLLQNIPEIISFLGFS
ncbi:MAG: hypothetical protein ACFFFC_08615 [Candidatus Thorarchaeota archaeon]